MSHESIEPTGPRDPETPPARRVVITGGPCSGKTTVIEALARRGFRVVEEAAIQVIRDLSDLMGVEGQAAWRKQHRDEFQVLIIEKQEALERHAAERLGSGPVFLDRGRLDGIAYCQVYAVPVPPEVEVGCRELPYERVFLLDTLQDFEGRAASGRTSDRAASVRIRDMLRSVYGERGFEVIEVPELPVDERVQFVLARC